jgi:glycerol dehydrogenase-like iron-containing ADH family enzyme
MLDWTHLEEVTNSLPDDAELVVGLGGGTALDASKYVALRKNLPLKLVPTVVSTGAIIHGVFAKWDGRSTVGSAGAWPYCDFEYVLVDYDLVMEAPWYINTAGLGDVLCGFSGYAEWEYSAGQDLVPAVDSSAVKPTIDYYEWLAENFSGTLDTKGELTAESIKFIMTSVHERDDRQIQSVHAPGAGHSMTGVIEESTQRGLIHGEMAALGAVLVCWITGHADRMMDMFDRCRVRYRPIEIGLTKDETREALALAPSYFSSRETDTVLAREPIVGKGFEEVWKFLENHN